VKLTDPKCYPTSYNSKATLDELFNGVLLTHRCEYNFGAVVLAWNYYRYIGQYSKAISTVVNLFNGVSSGTCIVSMSQPRNYPNPTIINIGDYWFVTNGCNSADSCTNELKDASCVWEIDKTAAEILHNLGYLSWISYQNIEHFKPTCNLASPPPVVWGICKNENGQCAPPIYHWNG